MYGTLIASNTVGAGGATTVTFTGIPSTYTDLYIVISARGTFTNTFDQIYLQFNSDATAANYSQKWLLGTGSGVASGSSASFIANFWTQRDALVTPASGVIPGANATANTFGNVIITIPNYAGSTNKSISLDGVGENNATLGGQQLISGLWANTAAINRIDFTLNTAFVQYSTIYIYGLINGSGGATAA